MTKSIETLTICYPKYNPYKTKSHILPVFDLPVFYVYGVCCFTLDPVVLLGLIIKETTTKGKWLICLFKLVHSIT